MNRLRESAARPGAWYRTRRGAAAKLSAALEAAGVDYDVNEYPGAGHSFLNNHPRCGAVLRGGRWS